MTTGRINQVAIVTKPGERDPSKGTRPGGGYRQRRRRLSTSLRRPGRKGPAAERGFVIVGPPLAPRTVGQTGLVANAEATPTREPVDRHQQPAPPASRSSPTHLPPRGLLFRAYSELAPAQRPGRALRSFFFALLGASVRDRLPAGPPGRPRAARRFPGGPVGGTRLLVEGAGRSWAPPTDRLPSPTVALTVEIARQRSGALPTDDPAFV